MEIYFFLNSSSHESRYSTAKPQKLFCTSGLACSPWATIPPNPPTTIQWGGPQKKPAPAATGETRPETKQRSSTRLHHWSPKQGKRKPPCRIQGGKWVSGQSWRGRQGGSATKVTGTNAQQVGIGSLGLAVKNLHSQYGQLMKAKHKIKEAVEACAEDCKLCFPKILN